MKKLLLLLTASAICTLAAADIKKITPTPAVWKSIKKFDFIKWVEGGKPAIPTYAQFTYDDNRLYLKITCTEPNLNEAKQSTRYTNHDAPVWINECVEIFVADEQKTTGYYQFAVDVHNAGAELRHGDPKWPLAIKWNGFWSHSVEYTDTSFTVNASIPWKTINVAPGKNQNVWFNISRMRKIHPWGRSVLSEKTPKQLHSKAAFIHFGNLNIAAPAVTGTVKHGTPLASLNTFECTLKGTGKAKVDGTMKLLIAKADGTEEELFSKAVSIPAGKEFTGKFTYRMPYAGSFPVRVCFVSKNNACDVWGDNFIFSVPLEIGEPKPITAVGKDHSILARLYIPAENTVIKVSITDLKGKVLATKDVPAKKSVFFFQLPTAKLATGEYKLNIQLLQKGSERFKQTLPLLIVSSVF